MHTCLACLLALLLSPAPGKPWPPRDHGYGAYEIAALPGAQRIDNGTETGLLFAINPRSGLLEQVYLDTASGLDPDDVTAQAPARVEYQAFYFKGDPGFPPTAYPVGAWGFHRDPLFDHGGGYSK